MYLIDLLIVTILVLVIVKSSFTSTGKQFKKLIALIGGLATSYAIFFVSSLSKIFVKPLADIFDSQVIARLPENVKQYFIGNYAIISKLILFFAVAIVAYLLIRLLLWLIKRPKKVTARFALDIYKNHWIWRNIFAGLRFLVWFVIIVEVLRATDVIRNYQDISFFGFSYDFWMKNSPFFEWSAFLKDKIAGIAELFPAWL
jgi:hypothetical protein